MADRRSCEMERNTNETKIRLFLDLDPAGAAGCQVDTGIGFLDHMFTHVSKHGFMDIRLECDGDLEIDTHHTVEDIGIVFGKCLAKALGPKAGIVRYGSSIIPMDEALVLCAIDLSGRPYLNFDATFTTARLGDMDTEMFLEFFRAVAVAAGMNLHIKVLEGANNHHIAEGIFKAFARALDQAVRLDPRVAGSPSTKGMLE
ncbi:imidazoleglycerol-phosphate dehydratase HisB [Anaerotalea alkaliphila]|uniref:Imidazoleglycerol-phosphate dehydratase n=1 Tax=Anaerotalea alkaliphila TaxID=2662126 RepID=A0A7X5HXZ4_9FIRM|nr:imidazoleglycerol-phosphate dehydratase HisB [Anaerotalea alkaliphila]NDL68678.1 imidazoleglycerol-phosphate dehydratase HisB [Anaerotalea alkaliphila]